MKKNMFIKSAAVLALLIVCGFLIKRAVNWETPCLSELFGSKDCIYSDKNQQQITLTSMQHDFDIHYVENAKRCGNYCPAIHITTQHPHNRWIFFVENNLFKKRKIYPNLKLLTQLFSGPDEDLEKENIAIKKWEKEFGLSWDVVSHFYSLDQDFFANYAEPYGFFGKKISPSMGYAYAVQVDDVAKTIKCVGGISWGFKLPWWTLHPVMILPAALTSEDWQTDWEVFQKLLPDYKNIL